MPNPELPTDPMAIEEEFQPSRHESHFGDKAKLVDIMLNGEVQIIGPIETVCADIPDHANQVDVVDIPEKHANRILGVKIQKGEEMIRCVFKPVSGENAKAKKDTSVQNFYPRECEAYLVSEHFDFDLVPPTVIREVDGEIGALQLFLDHDYYRDLDFGGENIEKTEQSEDWQALAALDWMLANCERHENNIMVRRDDPEKVVAIDHGIIMSSYNYTEMALRGPSLQLTHDNRADRARVVDVPEWLLEKITDGIERQDQLNLQLENLHDLDEQQIESFWMRVNALAKYRKFLSKMNHKEATGVSFLGAGY